MSINKTSKQLLCIVKRTLNENKNKFTCDVDWEDLFIMAEKHGISGLIGYIIDLCENVPYDIQNKFNIAYNINIVRNAKRDILVNSVLCSFEKESIDYMPLKGYILQNMYPSAEMRDMCDVDILIRTEDFEIIDKLMNLNGFNLEKESTHEYIYTSIDKITIELHKSIVPAYNRVLYAYYGDGWKFAIKQDEFKHFYAMKIEDFYVYEVAHAAKHYLNGGIGIRHVIDLYILIKNSRKFEYNTEYIAEQLKRLGIEKFHRILSNLCMVWFEDSCYDNDTLQMAEYVINGALFGNDKMAVSANMVRTSGIYTMALIKRIIRDIFPKRIGLINRYPILKVKPQYYPIIVIYRWFDILLHRRGKIDELKKMPDKETVYEFKEHCKKMGVSDKL